MLTQLEMQERVPVWTVLSELFLDTSFEEADIQRIAAALRQSTYQRSEIKRILRYEVSPAFAANMFAFVGEWVPWSEDEVRCIMTESLAQRSGSGWVARIKDYCALRIVPSDWDRIAPLLDEV